MSVTKIEYNGYVNVEYEKEGKILTSYRIHNTGCNALFDYLTKCLSLEAKSSECPGYIMLYYNNGILSENNLGVPVLNNVLYRSKVKTVLENDEYVVQFRFIIPSNSLIDTTGNVLAIYSEENKFTAIQESNLRKPSAYVKLIDNNLIQNLGPNINILID